MLAYVTSPLNRSHDLRLKPEILAELRKRGDMQLIGIKADAVVCADGLPVFEHGEKIAPEVFLGLDEKGQPWFAGFADEHAELVAVRSLMLEGRCSAEVLSILAQARSLVHWHETHGFCAACGAKSQMQDSGYRRHCAACSTDHFPRTDPVVIMAVRHKNQMLLGRQASWPAGMYSTLAGFVEPGETLEQAVRREVFEEAGVVVGQVRYCTTQPWPFPSSLMIGMIGETDDATLNIDTTEIEDARWFSPDEIAAMLEDRHPQGFKASHPYAIAHHLILTLHRDIATA